MDVVGQSIIHFSGQSCFDSLTLAAEIIANLALQGIGSGGMKLLETDFQVIIVIIVIIIVVAVIIDM